MNEPGNNDSLPGGLAGGLPLTNEFITNLVVALLHLAYRGNLRDADSILHAAQMRFIAELDEQERRDERARRHYLEGTP